MSTPKLTVEQRLWQAATKPMTQVELAVAINASRTTVASTLIRMVKAGAMRVVTSSPGIAYTYKAARGALPPTDRAKLQQLLEVYGDLLLNEELRQLSAATQRPPPYQPRRPQDYAGRYATADERKAVANTNWEPPGPKDADQAAYVFCETIAANAQHLRELGPAGPKPGGGADTPALCGAQVLWDKPNVPICERTLAPETGRSVGNPCSRCVELYRARVA